MYDLVAQLLRTDDELKHLNYKEKETPPQLIDSHNDYVKIRKRLGQFIKTKLKGTTAP